nr:MAG TPA: Protein of unknown function (DUF2634) [Caudoviricetes sp.]
MSVLKTYGSDTESFHPSKTYQIRDKRIEGTLDGVDAVAQAVKLLLSTERFEYEIYSTDYGVETKDLIGADREYIRGDLERRIRETLAEDDRITGISDFNIDFDRETALVTFTVNSIFGDFQGERSVTVG